MGYYPYPAPKGYPTKLLAKIENTIQKAIGNSFKIESQCASENSNHSHLKVTVRVKAVNQEDSYKLNPWHDKKFYGTWASSEVINFSLRTLNQSCGVLHPFSYQVRPEPPIKLDEKLLWQLVFDFIENYAYATGYTTIMGSTIPQLANVRKDVLKDMGYSFPMEFKNIRTNSNCYFFYKELKNPKKVHYSDELAHELRHILNYAYD